MKMRTRIIPWVVLASLCWPLFGQVVTTQQLLGSYRAAGQAYRDAAAKAPERRACYIRWAAYYEDVAAAVQAGRQPPGSPSSDPGCSGASGAAIGGGLSVGAATAATTPMTNAQATFNSAMGQLNAVARQYFAARAATSRERLAGHKQYHQSRSDWFQHRMDDFEGDEASMKTATQLQRLLEKTEGARIFAEAERSVQQSGRHGDSAVQERAYELLRGNPNPHAWSEFLERYPNSPLTAAAKVEGDAAWAVYNARIQENTQIASTMWALAESVGPKCASPTISSPDKSATVRCNPRMFTLIDGEFGFCEVLYEVQQRVSPGKKHCDVDLHDLYRFSMSDVNPTTISASGTSVALRAASPIARTTADGQAGLDCPAKFNVDQSTVSTLSIDFASASAAREAERTLRAVANSCRAGLAPSTAGPLSPASPASVSASNPNGSQSSGTDVYGISSASSGTGRTAVDADTQRREAAMQRIRGILSDNNRGSVGTSPTVAPPAATALNPSDRQSKDTAIYGIASGTSSAVDPRAQRREALMQKVRRIWGDENR